MLSAGWSPRQALYAVVFVAGRVGGPSVPGALPWCYCRPGGKSFGIANYVVMPTWLNAWTAEPSTLRQLSIRIPQLRLTQPQRLQLRQDLAAVTHRDHLQLRWIQIFTGRRLHLRRRYQAQLVR
jgi:hypothetical protein